MRVRVAVNGLSAKLAAGSVVRAVLLSRSVTNPAARGENGGHTLRHAMTVRAASTAAASNPPDALRLERPADPKADLKEDGVQGDGGLLVAAFVQRRASGRILAATVPVPVP